MSVTNPYYCDRTPTPSACILWGVAWQRVLLASISVVGIILSRLLIVGIFGGIIFIVKRTSTSHVIAGSTIMAIRKTDLSNIVILKTTHKTPNTTSTTQQQPPPLVNTNPNTTDNNNNNNTNSNPKQLQLQPSSSSSIKDNVQAFLTNIVGWTVHLLRSGLVWLAFVLLVPVPVNPGIIAIRQIIILVFCIIWIGWTNNVMSGMRKLVVAEIERKNLEKHKKLLSITSSKSKATIASDLASKAKAAGQIVNMMRALILFVTIMISFGLLGVDLSGTIRYTVVYFLALIMALESIGKDTILGLFSLNNPEILLPKDELRGGALTIVTKPSNMNSSSCSHNQSPKSILDENFELNKSWYANMQCDDISLWRITGTSTGQHGDEVFVPSSTVYELGIATVFNHEIPRQFWSRIEIFLLQHNISNSILEILIGLIQNEMILFHPNLTSGKVGLSSHGVRYFGVSSNNNNKNKNSNVVKAVSDHHRQIIMSLIISFRVPESSRTLIPEFLLCICDHLHKFQIPFRFGTIPLGSLLEFPDYNFSSIHHNSPVQPRLFDGFAMSRDEFCSQDELQLERVIY
jgi:hypothetical protein